MTWGCDGNVAAVLLWDPDELRGDLWVNGWLVFGSLHRLLRIWARNRIWRGETSGVMTWQELETLARTLAASSA